MTEQCPICNGPIPDGASECPACGYRLLGRTESFSPVNSEGEPLNSSIDKTPDQQDGASTNGNKKKSKRIIRRLRVVRGPQTGVDIELREGSLSMGRDPRCDIFLNDMTVSRKHAEIEVTDKSCVLRDLSSYNGVWVNDRAIDACLLKPGDLIQIGAFCLAYSERA